MRNLAIALDGTLMNYCDVNCALLMVHGSMIGNSQEFAGSYGII